MDDNNVVLKFVNEHIKKHASGYFTLKDAKTYFKSCDYYDAKITLKTALERILRMSCIEQKKIENVNHRSVFIGYSLGLDFED